ncbi:MAG TPA: hypothetical protein DC049_16065, partial [Spirochaetia bacterium]|nr:hypothetical protein [Spirochaetia bacterium]
MFNKFINYLLFILILAAGNFLFSMPSYDDVLLVVKSANTLSSDTANYFKAARLIPDANVCTITV